MVIFGLWLKDFLETHPKQNPVEEFICYFFVISVHIFFCSLYANKIFDNLMYLKKQSAWLVTPPSMNSPWSEQKKYCLQINEY